MLGPIIQQLESKTISMTEAFKSGLVPVHIKQHFACDCIERWMLSSPRSPETKALVQAFLQLKRGWIESHIEPHHVLDVVENLQQTSYAAAATPLQRSWQVLRTAWEMVGFTSFLLSPEEIAEMTSTSDWKSTVSYLLWKGELQISQWTGDHDLWEQEHPWQRSHLIDLLKQYQKARLSLLSLLQLRIAQHDKQRRQLTNLWEDSLFEPQ